MLEEESESNQWYSKLEIEYLEKWHNLLYLLQKTLNSFEFFKYMKELMQLREEQPESLICPTINVLEAIGCIFT